MDVRDATQTAAKQLRERKIDTPLLDADILLAHTMKTTKEALLTHPERAMTPAQTSRFFSLVHRRAKREPIAYLTGHKEFYGLDFLVDRSTLVPRPETELMVETALDLVRHPERSEGYPAYAGNSHSREILRHSVPQNDTVIIDVGTGSGAIIISIAKNLNPTTYNLQLFATDTSAAALRMARKNARRHNVRIKFLKGDLLSPRNRQLSTDNFQLIIAANLPYLPTRLWRKTQPEIRRYEPRTALDGGPDGLRYYRQLFNQIKLLVTRHSLPITTGIEIDPSQTKTLMRMIHKQFPAARVTIKRDLSGRKRVLIFSLKSRG